MTTTLSRFRLLFLPLALFALIVPTAWADELDSIRFGESALAYSSGAIRKATPLDGIVNVITGDNQTTGDRMIVGWRDTLYLRLNNPNDVAVGDLYTIYKRVRKVFHPVTGEYLGHLIQHLAITRVVQVDHELTTVQTVRSYGAVEPGNPVMKFVLPAPRATTTDRQAGNEVKGVIVDFQADRVITLAAQRNVVYVDKGGEDGLNPGDRLEIVRFGGGLPQRSVGELKILSTEAKTASALITKSTSRILVGDRIQATIEAAELVPVSQSLQATSAEPKASAQDQPSPRKFQVQDAAGETRLNLNDLARQLRFDSGDATIKPEGHQVLDQVVEYLNTTAADKLIRIEGHADNMEIGPSLKSRYPTNWDLSKSRAGAVVRYLIEKGGIDSARLSSVGYGDTRPIVSNATEAGRQQNRRVDVVLYSPAATQRKSDSDRKAVETTDSGYSFSSLGSGEGGNRTIPDEQPAPALSPDSSGNKVPQASVPDAAPVPASPSGP